MTQEFYVKTQSLLEEYKKSELQYMNLERKLNSSMMRKRDENSALQEYLQKMNQREKENEETYRNIMRQMEELDRHTDFMSLQLEKLEIFRGSIQNLTFPNQSFPSGSHLQSLGTSCSLNVNSSTSNFESGNLSSLPSRCASTQTEKDLFCNNCQSFVNLRCQPLSMENLLVTNMNTVSGWSDKPQDINLSRSLNESGNNLHFTMPKENSEPLTLPANQNKNDSEKKTDIRKDISMPAGEKLISKTSLDDEEVSMNVSKSALSENIQNISENSKINESQFSMEKNESKSTDSDAYVDVCGLSKSDAESINHEFDFLESDTAKTSSKSRTHDSTKNRTVQSSNTNISDTKCPDSEAKQPSKSSAKHKIEKTAFKPDPKTELRNELSETSSSVSGPQSPNISVASDSESMSEKGTSLKASYQALLANTVIPPKSKKNEPESDSEDEVENTLASAVQQSIVKPKLLNTQQKLGKNTKKILGLDTSSGSDVEAVIKAPEKKIDEDSDEFAFFD